VLYRVVESALTAPVTFMFGGLTTGCCPTVVEDSNCVESGTPTGACGDAGAYEVPATAACSVGEGKAVSCGEVAGPAALAVLAPATTL
jgi:hypothetical protein